MNPQYQTVSVDHNMNKELLDLNEKYSRNMNSSNYMKPSRIPRPKSCNDYYLKTESNNQYFNTKQEKYTSILNLHSRCHSANSMLSFTKEKYLNKSNNTNNNANKYKNNKRSSLDINKIKNIESLTSFRRSLKLLGIKLEDLGLDLNDSTSECNLSGRTSTERSIPRLQTRVLKRSVSLNDLQNIVQQASLNDNGILADENQRKTLSKAVYEEWYFNKQKLLKIQKEKDLEKKRREEEEIKAKEQKRKSAEEKFFEWQQNKKLSEKKKSFNNEKLKNSFHKKLTKEEAEEAYNSWKIKKDKELSDCLKKQKELLEKQEELKKIKQLQKSDAQKAYDIWKEKMKIELKKINNMNQESFRTEKERKKNELNDKKKNAELSFKYWKKNKDQEINKKNKEKREIENYEKKVEELNKTQRKMESIEAYNDWLDKIAQRELLEKHRNYSSLSLRSSVIPWIPPGKSYINF